MPSHIRRVWYNTRERALSTDWNDMTTLMHRALLESAMASEGGDTPRSGVLRGLTVSVVGGTLTVTVAPGLALRLGTAATGLDSTYDWIELREPVTVNLTSSVDAQSRWACIQVAPSEATEVTSLRDIFDSTTSTISQQSVPKVIGSSPTVSIALGTPNATPAFPAGVPGTIPLAYVYIPGGATSIDANDVVLCRPLLLKPPKVTAVSGGGVAIGSSGAVASLHPMSCLHASAVEFGITDTASFDLSNSSSWVDGQSYPASVQVVSLYACPPPYPTGYTGLATREFVPGSTAAGRIRGAVTGTRNCIVAASTNGPLNSNNPIAGVIDGLAPNDPVWAGTAIANSVYLGACLHDGSALVEQSYSKCGDVAILDQAAQPTSANVARNQTNTGAGDYKFTTVLTGGGTRRLPNTCVIGYVNLTHSNIGLAVDNFSIRRSATGVTFASTSTTRTVVPTAGGFYWTNQEVEDDLDQTLTARTVGYRDGVLASR